jgi:hypothetical protein
LIYLYGRSKKNQNLEKNKGEKKEMKKESQTHMRFINKHDYQVFTFVYTSKIKIKSCVSAALYL